MLICFFSVLIKSSEASVFLAVPVPFRLIPVPKKKSEKNCYQDDVKKCIAVEEGHF